MSDADVPRRLTVVRHANAGWERDGEGDFERTLSARGEREAPETGHRIEAWRERPTLVLASDARRAVQTTQALVAAWRPPPAVDYIHELYLASADRILEAIVALVPAHLHVMLVGHNPGLTDFVNRLADTNLRSLPTCGSVRLRLWVPEWSDAGWGVASVEEMESPK